MMSRLLPQLSMVRNNGAALLSPRMIAEERAGEIFIDLLCSGQ